MTIYNYIIICRLKEKSSPKTKITSINETVNGKYSNIYY